MGTEMQTQTAQTKVDFGAGTCPEGFEIRSVTLPQELADRIRAANAEERAIQQAIADHILSLGGDPESYQLLHATDTLRYVARAENEEEAQAG